MVSRAREVGSERPLVLASFPSCGAALDPPDSVHGPVSPSWSVYLIVDRTGPVRIRSVSFQDFFS